MSDLPRSEDPDQPAHEPGSNVGKPRGKTARHPPDLQLRIQCGPPDDRTLSFTLNSSDMGYNFRPVGSVLLPASPRELLQRTFDRLSTWARRAKDDRTVEETEKAMDELADIGSNLYDELFPEQLKREYPALWTKHRGGNLTIITDDEWIPWGMVRPRAYDEKGQEVYEPLCEAFRLARWVADREAPSQLVLRSAVVIQPQDNLRGAQEEREYFAGLPARCPGFAVAQPLESVRATLDSFSRGETHLYHFACHGNFDPSAPDDSVLLLAGEAMTPSQITRDREAGLRRAHPLVFINACHGGQRARGLTRLGGWAMRFIRAEASAFIGPLWEINDESAARFAKEFYDRLLGINGHDAPLPIAEAFYEGRQVIKQVDPANPTWLAYVLYANPRARVGQTASGPSIVGGERSREAGHSARLKQWLEHWGFTEDPFATSDADNEGEVLWEFLLPRRYMGVLGDYPERPVNRILLGAPGAGKTATREAVRRDCVQGRVRAFPIRYTRFDHLLGTVEYDTARLDPRRHVDAILRLGFETLVTPIGRTLLTELDPEERNLMLSLSAAFADPRSQAILAQRLAGSASKMDWGRAEPVEALQAFVDAITRANSPSRRLCDAVYVLVDRVDEPPVPKDGALPLLRSLILAGDLLNVQRLAFKFFLQPAIGDKLLAHSGIPSSRLPITVIEWDGDHLRRMIEERLKYYSGSKRNGIEELCDPAAKQMVAQLWAGENVSPARVLSRCEDLLQRHVKRTPAVLFDKEDLLVALSDGSPT